MKNINLIYLIFLMVVIGCGHKEKKKENFKLDLKGVPQKQTEIIEKSQIVDTTYYVKLETSENSLIGEIGDLFIDKDYIIVLNNKPNQSVLVFDHEGNFLNKIGEKGKAGNEFVHIRSVWVDKKSKVIHLYDDAQKKVLDYSFDNSYLGSKEYFKSLDFVPNEIIPIPENDRFLAYSYPLEKGTSLLHLIDKKGNLLNDYFEVPFAFDMLYKPFRYGLIPYTEKNRKEIRILEYFSNKVYTLNEEDLLKPFYQLDLGFPNSDKKTLKSLYNKKFPENALRERNYNGGVRNFLESPEHIYYDYWNSEGYFNSLYFKDQNVLIKFSKIEDDFQIEPYQNFPMETFNNFFVSVYELSNLEKTLHNFKILQSNKDSIEKKATTKLNLNTHFYEVLKTREPTDNPVLVFTRYKRNVDSDLRKDL